MPDSGLTENDVAAVLRALTEVGADPRCPSCRELDWTGWETGGIPRVLLDHQSSCPPYLADRLDQDGNLIDWAHGLKVLALICNRCGFLRLHSPTKLNR